MHEEDAPTCQIFEAASASCMFKHQRVPDMLTVYSDSNWAGCLKTRKSIQGGSILFGQHCIKNWSSTQAIIALSSGEAEYYGVVKASSVGLGV